MYVSLGSRTRFSTKASDPSNRQLEKLCTEQALLKPTIPMVSLYNNDCPRCNISHVIAKYCLQGLLIGIRSGRCLIQSRSCGLGPPPWSIVPEVPGLGQGMQTFLLSCHFLWNSSLLIMTFLYRGLFIFLDGTSEIALDSFRFQSIAVLIKRLDNIELCMRFSVISSWTHENVDRGTAPVPAIVDLLDKSGWTILPPLLRRT